MKLLVVEDDQKIAGAVRRGLEAEGFTVDVADDGDDGLWMAHGGQLRRRSCSTSCCPGRNGFVVCRDLRAAGDWTPILMLTAKDGDLDEAEALDTGADDYLDEAVLVPGAGGPHPRAAAPARRARDPCAGRGRRPAHRPGSAGGRGRATPRSS